MKRSRPTGDLIRPCIQTENGKEAWESSSVAACLPIMPSVLGSIPNTEIEKKTKFENLLFPRVPNFIECTGHYIRTAQSMYAAWWAENLRFIVKDWGLWWLLTQEVASGVDPCWAVLDNWITTLTREP